MTSSKFLFCATNIHKHTSLSVHTIPRTSFDASLSVFVCVCFCKYFHNPLCTLSFVKFPFAPRLCVCVAFSAQHPSPAFFKYRELQKNISKKIPNIIFLSLLNIKERYLTLFMSKQLEFWTSSTCYLVVRDAFLHVHFNLLCAARRALTVKRWKWTHTKNWKETK